MPSKQARFDAHGRPRLSLRRAADGAGFATSPITGLVVQMCGDAHVRNLGAFAAPDGHLVFDINDFDETILGPWEWDLKRLVASLVLAGREAGDSDKRCGWLSSSWWPATAGRWMSSRRFLWWSWPGIRSAEGSTPDRWVRSSPAPRSPRLSVPSGSSQREAGVPSVRRAASPALPNPRRPGDARAGRARRLPRHAGARPPARAGRVPTHGCRLQGGGDRERGDPRLRRAPLWKRAGDPLFLQIKEEPPSCYTPVLPDAAPLRASRQAGLRRPAPDAGAHRSLPRLHHDWMAATTSSVSSPTTRPASTG